MNSLSGDRWWLSQGFVQNREGGFDVKSPESYIFFFFFYQHLFGPLPARLMPRSSLAQKGETNVFRLREVGLNRPEQFLDLYCRLLHRW